MSKSTKPVQRAPKPLTKEEQAQRVKMILAQKKEQLFHGCLFALLSNPYVMERYGDQDIVVSADKVSDHALKMMYNLEDKEGE